VACGCFERLYVFSIKKQDSYVANTSPEPSSQIALTLLRLMTDEGPPVHDGRIIILKNMEGKSNDGRLVCGCVMSQHDVDWVLPTLLPGLKTQRKRSRSPKMSHHNYVNVLEDLCDILSIVYNKDVLLFGHAPAPIEEDKTWRQIDVNINGIKPYGGAADLITVLA
jgi:hypothetical protein